MTLRNALWLGAGISFAVTLYGFQRPWRLYRSMEPYDNVEMPPDWQDKTEWVFARLMYPQHPHARFGRYYGYGAGTTGSKAAPVGRRIIRAPTGISRWPCAA